MGWRNLEIDHLIIGELITRPATGTDDQRIAPPTGPTDTEEPADTDVSGQPWDHEASIRDRNAAPRRGGEGTGGNGGDSGTPAATELRAAKSASSTTRPNASNPTATLVAADDACAMRRSRWRGGVGFHASTASAQHTWTERARRLATAESNHDCVPAAL
jgi:hypothetical protein